MEPSYNSPAMSLTLAPSCNSPADEKKRIETKTPSVEDAKRAEQKKRDLIQDLQVEHSAYEALLATCRFVEERLMTNRQSAPLGPHHPLVCFQDPVGKCSDLVALVDLFTLKDLSEAVAIHTLSYLIRIDEMFPQCITARTARDLFLTAVSVSAKVTLEPGDDYTFNSDFINFYPTWPGPVLLRNFARFQTTMFNLLDHHQLLLHEDAYGFYCAYLFPKYAEVGGAIPAPMNEDEKDDETTD